MKCDNLEKKKKILINPANACDDYIIQNSLQFEHKITYLGAGTIAAVLVFANEHYGYEWLLVIGLSILLVSCMVNLYSYVWFNKILRKDYNDFHEMIALLDGKILDERIKKKHSFIRNSSPEYLYKMITERIDQRNKKADMYNWINLLILFCGIIVTALYVILIII